MNIRDTMNHIKDCVDRCTAGKVATAHYLTLCQTDPNLVPKRNVFPIRAIRDCHDDLENTYLVRTFAVFEATLRDYWRRVMRRRTHPPARVIMNSIAARRRVQADVLDRAHAVRDFRNSLVHGGVAAPVTLPQARNYVNRFLANLPPEW
jgi:hypothetical protein